MKNRLLLLFSFSVFLSCNQNDNQKTLAQPLALIKNDSLKIEKHFTIDSAKRILSPAKDTLVFKLKMDSANQHITVPISITAGDSLFAILHSQDKKANIRISQIDFPDSTFDGPFGRTLDYKIKVSGKYNIIIGEDMMAGDRWNGEFTLTTWVK